MRVRAEVIPRETFSDLSQVPASAQRVELDSSAAKIKTNGRMIGKEVNFFKIFRSFQIYFIA